jgi:hypothetical protein
MVDRAASKQKKSDARGGELLAQFARLERGGLPLRGTSFKGPFLNQSI